MSITAILEIIATVFSILGGSYLGFKYLFKSEFNEGAKNLTNSINQLNLSVSDLKNVIQSVLTDVASLKQDVEDIKNDIHKNEVDIAILEKEIEIRSNKIQ